MSTDPRALKTQLAKILDSGLLKAKSRKEVADLMRAMRFGVSKKKINRAIEIISENS